MRCDKCMFWGSGRSDVDKHGRKECDGIMVEANDESDLVNFEDGTTEEYNLRNKLFTRRDFGCKHFHRKA